MAAQACVIAYQNLLSLLILQVKLQSGNGYDLWLELVCDVMYWSLLDVGAWMSLYQGDKSRLLLSFTTIESRISDVEQRAAPARRF